MPTKIRADEVKIALGVLRIASEKPKGIATYDQLKKEIPNVVDLNEEDCKTSSTRQNEPMWHQIIRNIKSHEKSPGNYIAEGYLKHIPRVGYQITDAGKLHLKHKGG